MLQLETVWPAMPVIKYNNQKGLANITLHFHNFTMFVLALRQPTSIEKEMFLCFHYAGPFWDKNLTDPFHFATRPMIWGL